MFHPEDSEDQPRSKRQEALRYAPMRQTKQRGAEDDNPFFADVWLFRQDFSLSDVVLLEGETCDVMYASADQIRELNQSDQFVHYRYLNDFLTQLNL